MKDTTQGSRKAAPGAPAPTDLKTKRPAKTQNPPPASPVLPKSEGVEPLPVVLPESGMAKLLGVPMKTLRAWRYAGAYEGTYAVRGHHVLYRPDLVIARIFGGAA